MACRIAQGEADEISCRDIGNRRNFECAPDAIRCNVDVGFARELLREIEVEHRRRHFQSPRVSRRVVDDDDRSIVIGILHVHRLACFLGSKVAAARTEIIVVQVPDHRRPRVVEHPLNDAGRCVLVAPVTLEHRALALIGQRLRLARVVGDVGGLAVAALERAGEHLEIFELSTAGVKVPHLVDRP